MCTALAGAIGRSLKEQEDCGSTVRLLLRLVVAAPAAAAEAMLLAAGGRQRRLRMRARR